MYLPVNLIGSKDVDITNEGFVSNIAAFKNKLNNLLTIPKYSFIFNREFELDLERHLFSQYSIITANLILVEIENKLLKYFPEIEIFESDFELDDLNRKYKITINIKHLILEDTLIIDKEYQSYV